MNTISSINVWGCVEIFPFLRREKREEVYKKRKNLVGKNTSHLPSVAEKAFRANKEYKQANNVKYLWTSNGIRSCSSC